tara:strand:+ start:927 stop:1130 length:204 start_codon:yes stop_codon:yes gene_type:complete
MVTRELKANFTIADEVRLETVNELGYDLTAKEQRDIIEEYIDAQLKKHGIEAFSMRMTYKSKVVEEE